MDARGQLNGRQVFNAIGGVALAALFVWYFSLGGNREEVQRNMQSAEDIVLRDAAKQYEIAKRNGSKMDTCVQAQLVAAAALQAKNEAAYQQWKAAQRADCSAAGLPVE